jgi:DNA-binding protein YbaB
MPCDSTLKENQTLKERMTEVQKALARLESYLTSGSVKVTIGANGAVAFTGWKDRDNVTDVCGYRTLSASNSWALRQAVARAEAMSGRKVNASAVAVGTHSHDGGKTWHKGH